MRTRPLKRAADLEARMGVPVVGRARLAAMAEAGGVRIADADRDRAATELREHFAAGRLTEDELNERLESVYRARTEAELAATRADLPRLPITPAQRRAELAARRGELRNELVQQTGAGLVPFAICTAIWVLSGAHSNFWPAWVLLFALIPLLRNGWRLYGPAPDIEAVERDLRRRRARDSGRRGRRDARRRPH
jgi:Domain of unknown function (DUF1707)